MYLNLPLMWDNQARIDNYNYILNGSILSLNLHNGMNKQDMEPKYLPTIATYEKSEAHNWILFSVNFQRG